LKNEHHKQLMTWACACAEHLLPLLEGEPDERILHALAVGREWAIGSATVGDARKASVVAHAAAREATDPVAIAVARAAGHAAATAYMADHALGPALYGLKAVKIAGKPVEEQRTWQIAQLPE
jgi:hypothetical protein